MVGRVEAGVLRYASLCDAFGWLRYVVPMALKLAIVGSGQGLKEKRVNRRAGVPREGECPNVQD